METSFSDIFIELSNTISKPESFLSVQGNVAEQLKKTTKKLYDLAKSVEGATHNDALPVLIVNHFDDEQVWQQVELQNEPSISHLVRKISLVSASGEFSFQKKKQLRRKFDDGAKKMAVKDVSSSDEEEHEDVLDEELSKDDDPMRINTDDDDEDLSEDEKHMVELLAKARATLNAQSDEEGDDSQSDDDEINDDFDLNPNSLALPKPKKDKSDENASKTNKKGIKSNMKRKQKTVVDDKFFKMAEMEMFMDEEDSKEDKRRSGELERGSSDEEIDYYADVPSNEEGTEGQTMKYRDFFDQPDDVQTADKENTQKKVQFDEEQLDNSDDDGAEGDAGRSDDEGEDITDVLGGVRGQKSPFEKRQERVKKTISDLEETALEEKPWQLKGEVSSLVRPENSLLEQDLDYEHTSRLAPVITEETTQALEDIIKQRIKDKAWDDVERQTKPTDEPYQYKKKIVLDQEKSKLSLGEVYEQEYLKKQQKEEEEKPDEDHVEIKKMMTSLFIKLDALSNFHYTPKPALPEVKIISNLPSIVMEEVAPISTSNATLMAPEEIQAKPKTELKAATEKTDTDRKRERRDKKQRQKAHYKNKEDKQKRLEKKGLGNKYAKEKALRDLKKQSKTAKGLNVLEDDKQQKSKLTSSTQFFTQLQDEVTALVQSKKTSKKLAKKIQDPAAKYKL